MSLSDFVERCEKFTYSERKKETVKYGVQSKTDPATRQFIESLMDGPLYHQSLALETCHGSHDVNLVLRAISVSSTLLRKRAIVILMLYGSDSDLFLAIQSLPVRLQIYSIHKLRKLRRRRRRPQVIDRLLEDLMQDPERSSTFRQLLPLGTREFVARCLPEAEELSWIDWWRLSNFQPEITQKALLGWALRSSEKDPRLMRIINQTIWQWALSESTSDMALDVVKVILQSTRPSELRRLEDLARRRPVQVVELVVSSEDKTRFAFKLEAGVLQKLPVNLLLSLYNRYKKAELEYDFVKLSPEQRKALFPMVQDILTSNSGEVSPDIVAALPKELREAEAKRHIALRIYEESPSSRIPYISFLPWAEAMKSQAQFLISRDAEIRALAMQWQLAAAKYDDAHLSEALQLVIKHQNEPSPVRDAMTEALSRIPSGRWKTIHLKDLAQVLRQSLDASDLSYSSHSNIIHLLGGIFGFHPRWAADQMALVDRERGLKVVTESLRLTGQVSMKEIIDILNIGFAPILENTFKKKDVLGMMTLKGRFDGERKLLSEWSEFLDTIEKFIELYDNDRSLIYTHSVDSFMEILKKNRPQSWQRLISTWIEKGSHLMECGGVFQYVSTHLQTLLPPFIHHWIKAPGTPRQDFWRWTQLQQEQYATRLVEDIENDDVIWEDKKFCIEQLGALSFVDPYRLISLANGNDRVTRDVALRTLGHLDNGQGVPTLIEALKDDRARIAIYALRSTFRSMSKVEALEILKSVPFTKVTVAKEVVRLIGDLQTNEAFQSLIDIARSKSNGPEVPNDRTESTEGKRLHVDILVAVFRAIRPYLEHEEAWKLLSIAAQDPDVDAAKGVLDLPQDDLPSAARLRFLQILLQLLEHPSAEVRIAALRKCQELPLQDPDGLFIPRLLLQLRSQNQTEVTSTAALIFQSYSKTRPELIGSIFRDSLTNRRKLSKLHEIYMQKVTQSKARDMYATSHQILSILKTDRLSGSLRLKLIFEGLPFADTLPLLKEMIPQLHADNLVLAESLIRDRVRDWEGMPMEELEFGLASHVDERARRLALEVLTSSVKTDGSWTEEKKGRIEKYRNDESNLVAEAAWRVDLPENET